MQKKLILTAIFFLILLMAVSNLLGQQNNLRNPLKKNEVKWLNAMETISKVYPNMELRKKITLKGQFVDADFAQLTKNIVVAEKYNEQILIHLFDENGNELWSRQFIGNQKEGSLYISKNGKTIVYNAVYLVDEEYEVIDVCVFNNNGEVKGSMQKSDFDLKPSESGEELYILTNGNHEVKPIKKLMYYDTSLNIHYFTGFIDDAVSVSYKVINDSILISFKDFRSSKPQIIEFYKKNKDSIRLISQYPLSEPVASEAPFCLERCFYYNNEIIYCNSPSHLIFDYDGSITRSDEYYKVLPVDGSGFLNLKTSGIVQYIGNKKSKLKGIDIDFIGKVYGGSRIDKVNILNDYILFYEDKKMADPDIISYYNIKDETSFSYKGKTYLINPDIKIFQDKNNIYIFGRQK